MCLAILDKGGCFSHTSIQSNSQATIPALILKDFAPRHPPCRCTK